jgi:hypothetical protein
MAEPRESNQSKSGRTENDGAQISAGSERIRAKARRLQLQSRVRRPSLQKKAAKQKKEQPAAAAPAASENLSLSG